MTGFLDVETLRLLQETAAKAEGSAGKATILHPDAEPRDVYLIVGPDGKHERFVAERNRMHVLRSIDQVGPFVKFLADVPGSKPVVWYSEKGVTVVIDDDKRRDLAKLNLRKTPQVLSLQKLEEDKPKLSQRDFIRLLKVDLSPCFQEDKRLLTAVRNVNFRTGSEVRGNLQHGKESLGRDIETAAVSQGAEDIPEEVVLQVQVFDDPFLSDESWDVRCAVEVLPQEGAFQLIPLPMQIRGAIDLELKAIAVFLAGECDRPVFHGEV